ncbi:hypothetical protein [Seonamhaeicola maritimus]|uniref:SRPBCC family protein n=1 Tax=Seonamhaeicola maritimus TaxID=2591822 RepID=A0A5C7GI31_9FLAO|nr:hypothetical protein [Seonamhaeicola maritimus]TXG37278.1 hypothetical protein FUA22_12000 [Seonamhaeicola maritimus]
MEFYRIVNLKSSEQDLQHELTLSNLEEFCTEIFNLNTPTETDVQIGGIWGEFTLRRNEIKGGIRFALVECPNALCWTITTGYPPNPDSIIIHLTINRKEKDEVFIEEINEFLDDIEVNLKKFLQQN